MKMHYDRACFSINCSIFVVCKKHSHVEIKEAKQYARIDMLRSKKEFVEFKKIFSPIVLRTYNFFFFFKKKLFLKRGEDGVFRD